MIITYSHDCRSCNALKLNSHKIKKTLFHVTRIVPKKIFSKNYQISKNLPLKYAEDLTKKST